MILLVIHNLQIRPITALTRSSYSFLNGDPSKITSRRLARYTKRLISSKVSY